MRVNYLLTYIVCLIIISSCYDQFDAYRDPWNSLVSIQGEFNKNNTLFKYATCDPCDYLIVVYKDFVQLLIDDPQQGKQNNILAFQFTILQDHYDQKLWDFDYHNFNLKNNNNVQQLVERTTKKGLQWSYQLTLPIEGLIIKGHSQFLYQDLIPLVSFIFSIFIFITFPFSGQGRRQQLIQIPRRTPLISLLILTHLQHMIFVQIVVILIKYLIYEESFLTKSFWYVLYMIPFAFIALQIVYLYDAIKNRYLKMFAKVQSARLRDIGLVLTFFVGIYGVGIALLMAGKGLWVFGYFSLYLISQIIQSLIFKAYPYLPLTGYYFGLVAYQMFLSNFEPLFWFEQQTWKQIAIYWGILFLVFIFGSILQKFVIGIEMVNQVLFQQSKNIQMGDQVSAKSTQVNLQA